MWLTSFGGIVSVFTRLAGYQHHLLPFWYFRSPIASVPPNTPPPPPNPCAPTNPRKPLWPCVSALHFALLLLLFRFCCCGWGKAILLLDFCGLSARSHIKIDWIPVKLISQVNAVFPRIPPPAHPAGCAILAIVNYSPRLVFYIKRQTPAPQICHRSRSRFRSPAPSYSDASGQTAPTSAFRRPVPGSVKIFDHLGSHGIYLARSPRAHFCRFLLSLGMSSTSQTHLVAGPLFSFFYLSPN